MSIESFQARAVLAHLTKRFPDLMAKARDVPTPEPKGLVQPVKDQVDIIKDPSSTINQKVAAVRELIRMKR